MNCKVKILGKDTSLKEYSWARKRSVTFLILNTFVFNFSREPRQSCGKKCRQMYGKIKNVTERFQAQLHPLNLASKNFSLVS